MLFMVCEMKASLAVGELIKTTYTKIIAIL